MPELTYPGVYVEILPSSTRPIEGVGTAIAGFVGVSEGYGLDTEDLPDGTTQRKRAPVNTPVLVANWSQYARAFGGFAPGAYLPHAVFGYFQNGGGLAYVVNVAAGNGSGAKGELPPGPSADLGGGFRAVALPEAGEDVTVEVTWPEGGDESTFGLVVQRPGQPPQELSGLSSKRGKQFASTVVAAASPALIRLEAGEGTLARPAAGSHPLGAGAAGAATPPPAPTVTAADLIAGLATLERIDEVTMVSVPDAMGLGSTDELKQVQAAMVAQCTELEDRMAILDPPVKQQVQNMQDWIAQAGVNNPYAVIYWPWLKVRDPLQPKSPAGVLVPPSGHVAGIWGRNDDDRGVHKAPANETVTGALDVELSVTDKEQGLLNPIGVNVIRKFSGRGIRVWGARTLASKDDADYRYVNVRRYMNYLRESIYEGTQWCVFEPNDQALWGRIERTIAAFLVLEWRKGALFGLTPSEAFFVKCDGELNTAESIDAGMVICQVGVAPVKPAEFVVFRLSQFSGGRSLTE